MNARRVEREREKVQKAVADLAATKEAVSATLERLRSVMDSPPVSLRRLALVAYESHLAVAEVWSRASWLAEHRRDLARAKAGKRRTRTPIWPYPADVLNERARRAERAQAKA